MNPPTADETWDASGALTGIRVSVSDPAELRSLREHLRRIRGAEVDQVAPAPGAGELGAGDVLQLALAGAGVLGIVIRTLPEFIRSRRSSVTVTVRTENATVTISGENIDDPDAIVKRMFPDA